MSPLDARAPTIVLLFVAFVLRSINLTGESLWRDEVDSVRFALEPLGDIFSRFTATGFNGPLYHLILRGWLALAGVNDFALRYLSVVCGVVLVALTYVLGRRMFGARAALIASWLAAVAPVLVWYSGEGKMYSLQPMLLALALYALLRATASSPRHKCQPFVWWGTFTVVTSLSFYIHVLSPLFLPVAMLFFVARRPTSRQQWVGGAIALALLTLPYVPLLAWQAPVLMRGGSIGHHFYPLNQIFWTLASHWLFGVDGRAPLLWPVPDTSVLLVRQVVLVFSLALIVFGLLTTVRGAKSAAVAVESLSMSVATLGWMILPALLIFVISLRMPLFLPRYVLWSAPAFYLLVGLGLDRLFAEGRVGRVAARAGFALVSAVSLAGVVAQIAFPIRPDLRSAVAYVLQHGRPGDMIVFQIPYAQHSFAYYAGRFGASPTQFQLVEAPFTNYGMPPEDVARTMAALVAPASRVWLFETEAAMWDRRGLVRSWFDEALRLLDRKAFRGVEVGLYRQARSSRAG
ncbi:MAG: glycosyltransferase family 39 protein [Thermoflexales bacterium]|nr:glycosyltransferase family 39 protein [Thermoflexales bacterium]